MILHARVRFRARVYEREREREREPASERERESERDTKRLNPALNSYLICPLGTALLKDIAGAPNLLWTPSAFSGSGVLRQLEGLLTLT